MDLLFNINPLKNIDEVKSGIRRIVARQKQGTPYHILSQNDAITDLLDHLSDFDYKWGKVPVVFRIAKIQAQKSGDVTSSYYYYYTDSIDLPNVKHDLDLIIKMLNHIREQKKLPSSKMPLFLHPSEITSGGSTILKMEDDNNNSYYDHSTDIKPPNILYQMCIIFQKGSIMFVGFVFGRDYVLLEG